MIFGKRKHPAELNSDAATAIGMPEAAERTSTVEQHLGQTAVEQAIAAANAAESVSAEQSPAPVESTDLITPPAGLLPERQPSTEPVTMMGQPETVADAADPRRVPGHPANENNDALKAAADDIRNTPINNTL